MSALQWDLDGQKLWYTGVEKTVLFVQKNDGTYDKGVAWNGVTKIGEKPTGAEVKTLYADNGEYCNLTTKEKHEGSIEAYMYPDEFMECDGSKEIVSGLVAKQQTRKSFALCYVTNIGNDVEQEDYGYKIVFVYGCKASPSQVDHSTIAEDTDPQTMSWDYKTTPIDVPGMKKTAVLVIDSTKADATKLANLEKIIYGDENNDSRLPMPSEIINIFSANP